MCNLFGNFHTQSPASKCTENSYWSFSHTLKHNRKHHEFMQAFRYIHFTRFVLVCSLNIYCGVVVRFADEWSKFQVCHICRFAPSMSIYMEVTTLKVRKYFYGTMFTEYSLVLYVCRIIYCIISGRWCACFYRLSPEMFGDGCIPSGHLFELIWFQDIPGMSHWYFKLNLDRYWKTDISSAAF